MVEMRALNIGCDDITSEGMEHIAKLHTFNHKSLWHQSLTLVWSD